MADFQLRPTADTTVYVSAALPATVDAAGYAALDWTEAKGFDNLGSIGDAYETGNFDAIRGGRIKYRAINDPGELDVSPADLPTDPGQMILKSAFDAPRGGEGEIISLRTEDEAGVGTYVQIMVSTWRRVYAGASDVQLRQMVMPMMSNTVVEYAE